MGVTVVLIRVDVVVFIVRGVYAVPGERASNDIV